MVQQVYRIAALKLAQAELVQSRILGALIEETTALDGNRRSLTIWRHDSGSRCARTGIELDRLTWPVMGYDILQLARAEPAQGVADKQGKGGPEHDVGAVQVKAENLVALMDKLRNESEYNFNMLCDHTAIDRISEGIFDDLRVGITTDRVTISRGRTCAPRT